MILLVLVTACCRPAAVPVVRTAAPPAVTPIPAGPAAIASFPAPAIAQPQRNVFAFRSVEDRRSRLSSSRNVTEGQARVPVLHRDVDVRPPDLLPSARYLGAFGPQTTPILVFKDGETVVNVALRKP